ncbi:MAG: hypothetical protein GWN18_03270, partial [Thermoplasmata archaeon]|nr:hypothetical protein [Thermoplasmata archaeon]NIS14607.1 hypothetical protein [Thermoplasmata archaeon]NIS18978.1 hypothetical protein [Thermoplasmata archaeon]NIT80354.1 hypothetical protein [Thermoplasmata archaeon]NIU48128.1 hypothetical protein [Thermoplasmata archaeon]
NSNWNNAAGITTLQDYPGSTPLTGITIRSCTFNNVQHGVYFIGATYSLVDSCTFTNSWRGVSIQTGKTGSGNPWRSTHHNTVKDCTFTNMRENNGCEGEA